MREDSWELQGVDAETQRLAEAEAARLGVSVTELLTHVLLAAPEADARPTQPAAPAQEPFRHRIDALERRLGAAMNTLEGSVGAVDSSLAGVAGRLSQAEALAAETADALEHALAGVAKDIAALRHRLGEAEYGADALAEAHEGARAEWASRCAEIEERLDDVAVCAAAAEAEGARLNAAHEALQRALAEDFNEFAEETDQRLESGLAGARETAEAAARHADEALARALNALRETREAFEYNLAQHAEETRARVQAAFADAAVRMGALAERTIENERAVARASEQLHGRISDVEDALHAALEDAGDAQRRSDEALAARLARAQTENAEAHDDLNAGLAELEERHEGAMARIKLLDAALSEAAAQTLHLGERFEARLAEAQASARLHEETQERDWSARSAALASRVGDCEHQAAHVQQALGADIARVEACTLASLEKLGGDIASGAAALKRDMLSLTEGLAADLRDALSTQDGALAAARQTQAGELARIEAAVAGLRQTQHDARAQIEASAAQTRDEHGAALARLESGLADTREHAAGVLARLRLLERSLGEAGSEADLAPVGARLARLEAAVHGADSSGVLAMLQEEVTELSGQMARHAEAAVALQGLPAQIEALAARQNNEALTVVQARLGVQESKVSETADRMHGLVRMLGRISAQNADAATQTEDRLHKIELTLADLRLKNQAAPLEPSGDLAAIDERLGGLEQRQAETLDALRASIAEFAAHNEERLAALEQASAGQAALSSDDLLIARAIEVRLTELEQRDVPSEFEALRQRIEERIVSVEGRSVRALEQLSETIAVIERRMQQGGAETETKSA